MQSLLHVRCVGFHRFRHGRQQLVHRALRGGRQSGIPEGARLGQQQCAQFGFIQTRNLRPPSLFQLPAALGSANGRHRDPGRTQGLEIAMNGALRDLELLGQFALRHLTTGLEQKQDGHQTVGFHGRAVSLNNFYFLPTYMTAPVIYGLR